MPKKSYMRGPLIGEESRVFGRANIPRALGIDRENSPGVLDPLHFHDLVNARWTGVGVGARGGATKLTPSGSPLHASDAEVYPDFFEPATPSRLWYLGDGCPGESNGTGIFLGNFDIEQSPQVQRAAWYQSATGNVAIGLFGNQPLIGIDDTLKLLQLIPVPFGVELLGLAGASVDQPLVEYEGFLINFIIEHQGVAVIGLRHAATPATMSKVVTWDGVTTTNVLTGIAPPIAAGLYRDELLVALDAATDNLRQRDQNGTWTTLGATAATVFPGLNSVVAYKDVAYLAAGADIESWDGSTLTAAVRTPTASGAVESMDIAFGYLFYGHRNATLNQAYIGRFDGTTWADQHKDLTAQVATTGHVRAMRYFKETLAVVTRSTAGVRVMLSPGRNTSGTYVLVPMISGYGADIYYAVVF